MNHERPGAVGKEVVLVELQPQPIHVGAINYANFFQKCRFHGSFNFLLIYIKTDPTAQKLEVVSSEIALGLTDLE